MRQIQGKTKLHLAKETLRTLGRAELALAAGGSGLGLVTGGGQPSGDPFNNCVVHGPGIDPGGSVSIWGGGGAGCPSSNVSLSDEFRAV